MNMYIAIIFAAAAMFFWPEKNIVDMPFAALTLRLIASTIFALYLSYCSLKFGFLSFSEDKFWPWKWTKRIVILLSIRFGWLALLAFSAWLITEHKRFGETVSEYPIVFMVAIFVLVTFIVCAGDDEFLPGEQTKTERQLHE